MCTSKVNRFVTIVALCVFIQMVTIPAFAGEEVNYRLKWLFNMSVAGDLVADEKGLFADAGLDVTVKAGGPERDAIKELELGYAHFGVASADQVIRALSKGASVVVLAQLFQINPLQWIYRSDKFKVSSTADLKGKTIGITYGGNDETIMRTLLAKENIGESQVSLFSVRYDYTPFYLGKVDIWPVYRNSQGIFIGEKLQGAGEPVAFFNPAEHGVTFVANSVVTSQRFLAEHPETVRKFITALLKGWQLAFDPANKAQTVQIVKGFDKDTDIEIIDKQFDITRSLVQPDTKVAIGSIDTNGWKQTEQVMLQQKVIDQPVHVEKWLRPTAFID